jgi:phosphoserine aminotransferase
MASPALTDIKIPAQLLPLDGRFGSGPSKIRAEQIDAVVRASRNILGTSHRQAPVKNLVGSVIDQMRQLFQLPSDWEVVVGNGGASLFWDAATFGLIYERSAHLVFGEFSSKFAQAAQLAPHLGDPIVIESAPGTVPTIQQADDDSNIDTYCLTHNETSTGASMQLSRPATPADALVVVDGTSAAGGINWSPTEVDVYYFSPQKGFASEGGTWIALCSPRAVERINKIKSTGRWCPPSLDISLALENSRANQTYNTPSLSTFVMLNEQLGWMLDNGGLDWCTKRTQQSANILYGWATSRAFTEPFVANPQHRSPVVGTIDFVDIDAAQIATVLRNNGVVDTEPYRKLGRNQLRVSMFPAVDPSDVQLLTSSIDYIVEQLS